MFEKGDLVVCIDAKDAPLSLVEGKTYRVIKLAHYYGGYRQWTEVVVCPFEVLAKDEYVWLGESSWELSRFRLLGLHNAIDYQI